MKPKMLLLSDDSPPVGLSARFRRATPGPESDLVDWFLEAEPLKQRESQAVAVFREPKVETGFPDLVVVMLSKATAAAWPKERRDLKPIDLRVMHYLGKQRSAHIDLLTEIFSSTVHPSLDRLQAAEMVRQHGSSFRPHALQRTFAARRIIAIEAKVGKWASALRQAKANQWFASESWILLPNLPDPDAVLPRASSASIGVITRSGRRIHSRPNTRQALPRSYASWLFNDWAWRAATFGQAE